MDFAGMKIPDLAGKAAEKQVMRMSCLMHSCSTLRLLLGLTILVTAGCSRLYTFTGIVVDGDGKPIEGAAFAIQPHGWNEPDMFNPNEASGADGRFNVHWSPAVT
jgi:hypothetical protein